MFVDYSSNSSGETIRLQTTDNESILFASRLLAIETFSSWFQLFSIIASYIGNISALLFSGSALTKNKVPIYRILVKYLACTDLIYSTAQVFLVHSRFNRNRWVFGGLVCPLMLVSPASITNSLFIVALVAVERYRCLVQPLKKKLRWTFMRRLMCLLIMFSFALYLPAGIHLRVAHELGYPECRSTFPAKYHVHYDFTIFAVAYMLPVTVTTYCYAIIVWRAAHNFNVDRNRSSQSHASILVGTSNFRAPARNTKSQKRLIFTLLAVLVMFVVTVTPNQAYILWSNFVSQADDGEARKTFLVFHSVACLVHVHSWVNPIIYCLCDRQFRQTLKKCASKLGMSRCSIRPNEHTTRSLQNKTRVILKVASAHDQII